MRAAEAARRPASFAEISSPVATLAIGSTRTVGLFAPDAARPAANQSVIIEFLVNFFTPVTAAAIEKFAR